MCFNGLFLFTCFIQIVFSEPRLGGWDYINLHCRDNDNRPVDWWYIYKPPVEIIPFRELGRDFIYITSDNAGRWQHSGRHINANSMLQNTEAPMFRTAIIGHVGRILHISAHGLAHGVRPSRGWVPRARLPFIGPKMICFSRQCFEDRIMCPKKLRPTYSDYLAVVTYEASKSNQTHGNPSLGVLMADEVGGVWISHTVPGLTDLTKDRPNFPQKELGHGHLLACLSLDLVTVNQVAALIKQTSPRFSRIQIPTPMRAHLPEWNFLEDFDSNKPKRALKQNLKFLTKNKSLQAKMIIRKPGEKSCLFTSFARNMNLVLDIYGHQGHKLPQCYKHYSLRKIERISMKSVEFVHYIKSRQDRSTFAVSTAAVWQRTGKSGKDQYWTCIGPPDDNWRNGGILVCVDNYDVWQSFDNFKVKEPGC